MSKNKIVAITGNIGSGKTNLLCKVLALLGPHNATGLEEDVKKWIDEGWLTKFYENKDKNALSFQLRILQSQIETFDAVLKDNKTNIIVTERSPFDGRFIFLPMLGVDEMDLALYDFMYRRLAWHPTHVVYLRCDTKVAMRRIEKRNRRDEKKIDQEYISKLKERYDSVFQNEHRHEFKLKIVDNSADEGEDPDAFALILQEIAEWITQ